MSLWMKIVITLGLWTVIGQDQIILGDFSSAKSVDQGNKIGKFSSVFIPCVSALNGKVVIIVSDFYSVSVKSKERNAATGSDKSYARHMVKYPTCTFAHVYSNGLDMNKFDKSKDKEIPEYLLPVLAQSRKETLVIAENSKKELVAELSAQFNFKLGEFKTGVKAIVQEVCDRKLQETDKKMELLELGNAPSVDQGD